MPRGGPNAGRLSRWFDSAALEYLDRDDVPYERRARVTRGLDRLHQLLRTYPWLTRSALAEVADIEAPRIVELGAGHGGLSQRLLQADERIHVTVTDVDARAVAALAESELGRNPRAVVRQMDATSIDAKDDTWDLALFVLSFHHLEPTKAAAVIAEGCRVARRLMIVDAWRSVLPLALCPAYLILGGWPMVHDGVLSARRMYSASAIRHLASQAADPLKVTVNFQFPGFLVAVASRPS